MWSKCPVFCQHPWYYIWNIIGWFSNSWVNTPVIISVQVQSHSLTCWNWNAKWCTRSLSQGHFPCSLSLDYSFCVYILTVLHGMWRLLYRPHHPSPEQPLQPWCSALLPLGKRLGGKWSPDGMGQFITGSKLYKSYNVCWTKYWFYIIFTCIFSVFIFVACFLSTNASNLKLAKYQLINQLINISQTIYPLVLRLDSIF